MRARNDIIYILFCLLPGMTVVSCSSSDDMGYDVVDSAVATAQPIDLLVSVGERAMKNSQATPVTRSGTSTFPGIELMVAIPFHTNGNNTKVAVTDEPLIDLVGADEGDIAKEYETEKYNTYYVDRCHLMTGTNRMLVYGKAKPAHTDQAYNPAVHGKLSDLPTIRTKTENITFSLSSIRESTEADAAANALASYMTKIANTPGWSTTTDPTLLSHYKHFINADNEGGSGLMSGAAANIKAFVAELKTKLLERKAATTDDALKTLIDNIITNIGDGSSISSNTYPRSIELPDGAAVMRWTIDQNTGGKFEVRTTTTHLDNINGINRYTYPAEMMFFTDSPIRTSAEEVQKATYQNNTNKEWPAFLNTYYNGPTAVNTNTKAVAVENPLQYGVAQLKLTLTTMSATLNDAKNEEVVGASMTTLPMTGLIIGGQHTVGHDMKPRGAQTDVDGRFIYESTVDDTNYSTEGYKTSTLVLQSYDGEKVPVILEFENNTGHAFTGKDGTVYPGTRFYLIGMTDPAGKGTGAYANRVFTQDYTTTMSMSVTSLAKAYTCMPDLLAPRLEVGVQVVTKWIQATTTNVAL